MKTYTLFAFTGSTMLEICALQGESIDEVARRIDCLVESHGTGDQPAYRPHLIGARQCATLKAGLLTKDDLLRIATATKDLRLQSLLRNTSFRPTLLQIGDAPRASATFHGNDRLANNRDRASDPLPARKGSAPNGAKASTGRKKRGSNHKRRGGNNHREYDFVK